MRLLIASLAALAAVAFAAPSYAQTAEDSAPAPAAPAPVPTAKPKVGTTAYCQSLKTSSSRSACLKKLSASKSTKAPGTATAKKTTKKTTKTPTDAAKQPDVGQLAPPTSAPAPAAPASGAVAVPPLPSKTI
ncbi:MAG: hypothetical protein ISP49_12480 [Reyranella sp.]|nr:hypothetical protein [Reyranella sp.]MBL6652406.1 hypothetical protein [Reyranella sp.]